MAIRTWRDPALNPTEALMKLRNGIFACLEVNLLLCPFRRPVMHLAMSYHHVRIPYARVSASGGEVGALQAYQEEHETLPVRNILDVGCSVGVSARVFARRYPEARVTGLDASPHFLAVAEYQERCDTYRSRICTPSHPTVESGILDRAALMNSLLEYCSCGASR